MVIKKYTFEKNKKESAKSQLSQYRAQAKSFLAINEKRHNNMRSVLKSGLANILPLAAASLSPFVMQAQPCPGSPPGASVTEDQNCGGSIWTSIDIDGGGDDLFLHYNPGGFFARQATAANMTFARTTSGPYAYFIGYSIGATIDELSGNFGALNSQTATTCGTATQAYGWLDYEAFGTGGWNGLTPGTRVMGLTKDGFLGFIEITYDDGLTNPTTAFSIGEFGLANDMSLNMIEAGTCSSLLPVELVRFFGEKENENFVLGWQTASETNNAGFEVQRSTDGENFRKLAWIDGMGNSNLLNDYSYEDRELEPNQMYYYRLKQVDFDDKFEYSDILAFMNIAEGATTVKDFAPNPVSVDFADLRIISPRSQGAQVVVYDAMGKSVFEKKTTLIKGMHTIRLDLVNALSGTHFVSVVLDNGEAYFKKLIVAK